MTFKGNLSGYPENLPKNRKGYGIILDYEAQAIVNNEGGTIEAREGKLVFKEVDTLTIYLDAGTDYLADRSRKWRGTHPHEAIVARLEKACATPYGKLLAEHVSDYQSLFNRFSLDLGCSERKSVELPTNKRLDAYRGAEFANPEGKERWKF